MAALGLADKPSLIGYLSVAADVTAIMAPFCFLIKGSEAIATPKNALTSELRCLEKICGGILDRCTCGTTGPAA